MRWLAACLILAAGGCAGAPQTSGADLHYANVRGGRGYCPICTMWHDRSEMRWPVEYGGKHYVFCDPNCRATFTKDPQRYLSDPQFSEATAGYVSVTFEVQGFTCVGCARSVENYLSRHEGVKEIRATFLEGKQTGRIDIVYDPDVTDEEHLIQEIASMSDGNYRATKRIDAGE